jgi:mono/diheme cytochrome c family protein
MRSVVLAATAAAISAIAPARSQTIGGQDFPTIERGRYLTTLADCAACHTTPGSGKDFTGGRPIETPFGNLLAPNITPDRETGIGAWTDDEFVNSLLNGTGHGGERLYPAMPYTYLTRMSRSDALSIRQYLQTVPAVRNKVVSNQLPFPLDIRAGMLAWNWLFFQPGRFQARADKSAEWNRGAYLVEGPGHCGMCHTPKNILGGDKTDQALQGYKLQGWFAPDIRGGDYNGLAGWEVEDTVAYLETGHNRFAAAAGPMAEEVELSSSRMTEADLRAIAVYLKDQPGSESKPQAVASTDPAMRLGAAVYADECSACHTPTGAGIDGLFPSLTGAATVQAREPESLLHVVLLGTRSVATAGAPTAPAMPPFDWLLNDDQVAAVATYVRNAWGNAGPAVTAHDVQSARDELTHREQ